MFALYHLFKRLRNSTRIITSLFYFSGLPCTSTSASSPPFSSYSLHTSFATSVWVTTTVLICVIFQGYRFLVFKIPHSHKLFCHWQNLSYLRGALPWSLFSLHPVFLWKTQVMRVQRTHLSWTPRKAPGPCHVHTCRHPFRVQWHKRSDKHNDRWFECEVLTYCLQLGAVMLSSTIPLNVCRSTCLYEHIQSFRLKGI